MEESTPAESLNPNTEPVAPSNQAIESRQPTDPVHNCQSQTSNKELCGTDINEQEDAASSVQTAPKTRKRERKRKTANSSEVESPNETSTSQAGRDKPSDLKSKINRLKGKLETYSTKCNDDNGANDSRRASTNQCHAKERDRKSRTYSEQSNSEQKGARKRSRSPVRSMSFSSPGNAPLNQKFFYDDSRRARKQSEENHEHRGKKPGRKRERTRRKGRKSSVGDAVRYRNSVDPSDEFRLDNLSFFLLDLLVAMPHARDRLIAQAAKEQGILLATEESWVLNPQITQFGNSVFRRAYQDIYASDRKLLGKPIAAGPVKERPTNTFEDQVNSVVHTGLTEEQQKEFTLPIIANDQRKPNYFKADTFESNLEAFAQKCVQANLGVIVEADVRISAKNNDHAFIKVPDSDRDAMISSQLLRKFALQGDVVRAFVRHAVEDEAVIEEAAVEVEALLPDGSLEALSEEPIIVGKSTKAFVITIAKEVHNRLVVGSFLSYRSNVKYVTFIPRDMRLPNIRIYEENWPETFKKGKMDNIPDTLYVAEIIDWKDKVCVGRIKQAIGKCGELDSENRAILLKNNLMFEPFDEKLNEMYRDAYTITDDELKRREDLRQECIFTIDPLTAKDLDDAMSIKVQPDGNYEVGVHISDVAFFLDEDCVLDEQVKKRTTSVYMVNEVFHMLPKPLCFRCSLLPGDDKLAFSVFWIMTPNAEIVSTRFTRSVIRSCTQFAYQHAQMIIDNPEREFVDSDFPQIHNGFSASDVVRCTKQLNALATIMRMKRFENGALRIDRPKIYFDLDPETGAPIGYRKQEQLTANFLIEEFMLLANQSVAQFIYEKFPDISILRNHQPPLKNVLKKVKDQLLKAGLTLDVSSSKSIHKSLARLIAESENPECASICLSQLVSKPMTRAKYFCSHDVEYDNFKHYALSIPIYTHFTSPIRRYPDVLVHRVLAAALNYDGVPKRTPSELKTLAEQCNDDKYNAKLAGDDSSNLYFMHYVQKKGFVVMQAVVVDIFSYSFEAILLETGVLISVSWKDCNGVQVAVSKDNNNCKATLTSLSLSGKENELKLCSDIWLKVTVKSKRLRGEIVPPPTEKDIEPEIVNSAPMKDNQENCVEVVSRKSEPVERENVAEIIEAKIKSDEVDGSSDDSSSSEEEEAVEEEATEVRESDGEVVSDSEEALDPPGERSIVVETQPTQIETGLDAVLSQTLELKRLLGLLPNSTSANPSNSKIIAKNNVPQTTINPYPIEAISIVRKVSHPDVEIDDTADIVIEAEEVEEVEVVQSVEISSETVQNTDIDSTPIVTVEVHTEIVTKCEVVPTNEEPPQSTETKATS